MAHERLLAELDKRRAAARRMGGPEKLAQRAKRGQLNAQERLDALVDPGSFIELGLLGASALDADPDETPRDSKITGFGRIDGRDVGVVINDFTVKGSSTSATNSRKMGYIRRACTDRG
jgi:methylmalonyl-CoA decarboxylase subunit alpha